MTVSKLDPSGLLRSLTYGNGMFLAGTDSGRVFSSTDGISWTELDKQFTSSVYVLGYGDGKFLLITRDSNTHKTALYFSRDNGITWSSQGDQSFSDPKSIDYANGKFVITTNYVPYCSCDLYHWTPVSGASETAAYAGGYCKDRFIIGGYHGNGGYCIC